MTDHSPALRELARRLVEYETRGSFDRGALSAALERVCEKLSTDLTGMLGHTGYQALLRRSLHLAQRERTLLSNVSLNPERENCFVGLTGALSAGGDEEAAGSVIEVVEHLLTLLVTLLGEELGTQPMRRIWRDVTVSPGETNE